MTAPARLTQADMERATKAVKAAKIGVARIVMDFANQRIEVIIGDPGPVSSSSPNPWDAE